MFFGDITDQFLNQYGFAYTGGTGYQIRNLNYDANLLYSPPPYFPLSGSQYVMNAEVMNIIWL